MYPGNLKKYLCCFALLIIFCASTIPLEAQQKDRSLFSLQCELEDIKQKVHCYELERDILEEKVNTQGEQIVKLQKELTKSQNANEELSKGKLGQFEKRLTVVEQKVDGFILDLKQLKSHANDTSSSLSKYSSKITDIEQSLQTNVTSLKSALQSLVKVAYKGSESGIMDMATSSKSYKVKPGDTLERIAKNHGISVDTLKKRNNLSKDRIVIGQELTLED
ncbi:MAG: LysM peptidoglycan-binding domain-containing protein [Chlamydiales bacterium]|nr:LysM peptidoglycan-binding domain-containing protein [Chlamydiales bacterium]